MKSVHNRKAIQQVVAATRDCVAEDEKALIGRYNQRHIAKAVYSSKIPFFITQELRSELKFLRFVLSDPKTFPWVGHIAHIIPRDHDFVSYGDSSPFAAGGYSIGLNFWWHVEWPVEIQKKTLKYFQHSYKDASTGEFIFINLLEYVTAILNYAAASVCFRENSSTGSVTPPFPVLLNFSDNEFTNSWIRKTPFATAKHRALSILLCRLRLNNCIGLNAAYVSTFDNYIADHILRLHRIDFGRRYSSSCLLQKFPILTSCQRFLPSHELFSSVIRGLPSSGSGC